MKACAALLGLGLAVTLTACTTTLKTPEQIASAQQTLQGSWTLQKASEIPDIPANILLTLRSDSSSKDPGKLNVSGFSGVNHFVGGATVSWPEQRLVFGNLATTRMMGPEPRMQFEQSFLKQMGEVASFKLQDDKLVLKTLPGNTLTFVHGAQ